MSFRNPTVVATIVALVAVVAIATYYFRDSRAPGPAFAAGGPSSLVGAPAQSYDVDDLAGKPDSLASYRGRVVLLNLWATWCPPCRSEIPSLERLYREDSARGLVVLGVDQGESAGVAAKFAKDAGVTYPILVDLDQRYGRTYAAVGLPTSLLVGRDGRIVSGFDGELSFDQMRAAVRPLLGKS